MNYNSRVKVLFILKLISELVDQINAQSKCRGEGLNNYESKVEIKNDGEYYIEGGDEKIIEENKNECEHIPVCECATEFYAEQKIEDKNNTELTSNIDSIIVHSDDEPMKKVLHVLKIKGLIKADIHFIDGKETKENVNIVSVNNFFVEIFDPLSEENIIIPINQISAVCSKAGASPSIPESALINLELDKCSYCLLTLEEYFKNNLGSKVVIITVNNLNNEKYEITAVGKGIVVLNNNLAISIPKIKAIKIEPQV